MQHESVKKLFREQLGRYSKKDQAVNSPIIPLFKNWIKKNNIKKTLEICEFGGGSGQLLNEIRKSYPKTNLTNVEIISDYKNFLVLNKIKFVLGSVLVPDLASESFDVIIMRDILHHLIGKNYKETMGNQKHALSELKRLVKPGGVIFLEELINESEIATRIIYCLCWLNTKIGVHIPRLFISKNVIVSFLTSNKLINMSNKIFGEKNIKKQELDVKVQWYFRLLHFFGGLKKIILSIKK